MPRPNVPVNKEDAIALIEQYFKSRRGEDAPVEAVNDAGFILRGADEIYEELIKGERLVSPDPEEEGAYDALEFNEDGNILTQWISPEGGIKVNEENLNIAAPDLPDYMTVPDEPEEELVQTEAAMISANVSGLVERHFGGVRFEAPRGDDDEPDKSRCVQDDTGKVLADQADIAAALLNGDQVFIPGEKEGTYDVYSYENGALKKTKQPETRVGYVASANFETIDKAVKDPLDILLEGTHVVLNGESRLIGRTKEEIDEQLKSGNRLMFYDRNWNVRIAGYKDGRYYATDMIPREDPDPENYNIDPGRDPQNIENRRILGWREDQIDRLETADGRTLTDPAKIREALKDPGSRSFVYMKDQPEFPYAVENRDGSYYTSDLLTSKASMEALGEDSFRLAADQDLEGVYLLNIKKSSIDYAVDENGVRFETPEELAETLKENYRRLKVYTDGEASFHEVIRIKDRFYTSKEKLPPIDELDDEFFRPIDGGVDTAEFLKERWDFDRSEDKEKMADLFEGAGLGPLKSKRTFDFALDEEGNEYRDLESVTRFLENNDSKNIFIFDKETGLPYAVNRKDEDMFISDEPVTPEHRLFGSHEYTPKKSLDIDDIIKRPDKGKMIQAKDRVGDWKKLKKFFETNIKSIETVKNAGKPDEPKKPSKPSMGFWNTIAYGFVFLFTAGRGETEAHKQREETYRLRVKNYNERLDEYRKKKDKWDDYEKNGEKKLTEFREGLEKAKAKIDENTKLLNDASMEYNKTARDNDSTAVRIYRSNTEVLLQGAADLKKEGRITRNNVFANTWLKQAKCSDKKASDPAARKALVEYIASRAVEEQIVNDRADGDLVNVGVENRRIEELNSGRAYRAIEKDEEFQKLLDSKGDGDIQPGQIYNEYTQMLAKRSYESKGYVNHYTEIAKSMNFTFGEKKVDESCLDDLIRLDRLQKLLERDKGFQKPYDEKSAKEIYNNARASVTDLYRKPITQQERDRFLPAVNALKGGEPMKLDDMLKAVKDKSVELQQQAEVQQQGPQAVH